MKDTEMKRIIPLLLCLALTLGITVPLAGCDSIQIPDRDSTVILCANFAAYDFARSLLSRYAENGGEGKVELVILGKPGQDMHSFEPTLQDIVCLSFADVVISTGVEEWLDAAMVASENKTALRVSMTEACDVDAEHHHHDHGHEHDHSADGSEDGDCALIGSDEHVWLSVEYATRIVHAIEGALKSADPANAEAWERSAEAYNAELTALKEQFHRMVESAPMHTVVLADRHPFVYLFHELELDCVAAFPGCSSEIFASFETQTKLIEAVKSHGLSYIFVMEGSDGNVAEVIAEDTGAEILTLNSLQVVTDYESTTYLDVMRQNLENLKKALQ